MSVPTPTPAPAPTDPTPNPGDPTPGGDGGKTFTQADLDRIVTERLNRQKAQFGDYDALKAKAADFDKLQDANKSELEKAQEAARKAEEARVAALSTANTRLIAATAKVTATELGVKPERIAAALKLADLSAVAVGDDGEPDAAAVKAAIEKVLADVPELKAAAGGSTTSTANPARGAGGIANPWARETLNLTEQGRIARENPTLAAQLRAAAGA